MVYNNNNNIINNNLGVSKSKDDILNHPYIILGLVFAFIIVVVYVIYKYAVTDQPLQGYTFFANDILKLDPLFTESASNVDECINLCKQQSNCEGITFDSINNTCVGQKNGRLRTDEDNYYSWVKRKKENIYNRNGSIKSIDQIKPLIDTLKSNNKVIISSKDIPSPPFPDTYSCSFVIKIQDWYENYSYWRHILHKGTPIDKTVNNKNKMIQYHNWEKIAIDIPEQSMGFWLSPFQNNLRIAITTVSKTPQSRTYPHANIEKCLCKNTDNRLKEFQKEFKTRSEKAAEEKCSNCWITDQEGDYENAEDSKIDTKDFVSMDYIDVQDLQTNIATQIALSVQGNIIEVYVNGVFKANKVLNGTPRWSNGDLYIHNQKTYKGELNNLMIIPSAINGEIAKQLYNNFINQ
jgi:hypothetical protein